MHGAVTAAAERERWSARRRQRPTKGSFPAPTAQPADSPNPAPLFFRLRMCCFIIEEALVFFIFYSLYVTPPRLTNEVSRRETGGPSGSPERRNAGFIRQSGEGIKGLIVECCYYSL